MNTRVVGIVLILLALWMGLRGGVSLFATPDAVVYTYEKDESATPSAVLAALDKLNRQGIDATVDEADTTNGDGEVPDQYKVSRPAAVAAGLPALVVMGSGKVVRVVKNPQTEESVLEAAQ